MLTLHNLLLLIAAVVFVLAAFGVASRVNLIAVGLALFAAAFLTGCTPGAYQVNTPHGGGTIVLPKPTPNPHATDPKEK